MVTGLGKEGERMEYLTLSPEVVHTSLLLLLLWPEPVTRPNIDARRTGNCSPWLGISFPVTTVHFGVLLAVSLSPSFENIVQ